MVKLIGLLGAAVVLAAVPAWSGAGTRQEVPHASCEGYQPNLPDPSHFVDRVDNQYFPLPPGRVLVYRGVKDGEAQRTTTTVTHNTKVILGIHATVVHDVVTHDGQLREKTIDWYAQDDQGNVWYLGEDTKSYEDGTIDTSGSWQAGVNGAKPGLIMEADPRVPDAYRQECLAGEAMDTAWVVSRGGSITVPYGQVHDVLRSLEFTQLEPDVVSEKGYGPGIGIVVERDIAGGDEFGKLVSVTG